MPVLDILTRQLDRALNDNPKLFEDLGLLYCVNETTETNVADNTGTLNIDEVIRNQPNIWLGTDVLRTNKKKKILLSDAEYLMYMEAFANGLLQIKTDGNGKIISIDQNNQPAEENREIQFVFAIWQILIQKGFAIYLWGTSQACLLEPIHTYRDFLTRFNPGDLQYDIADAEQVKKQLIEWGEIPNDWVLVDNRCSRDFFSEFMYVLFGEDTSNTIPEGVSTEDWDFCVAHIVELHISSLIGRSTSYKEVSKYAPKSCIKILNQLALEQDSNNTLFISNPYSNEMKQLNSFRTVFINNWSKYPFPLNEMNFTNTQNLTLRGYMQGPIIDLSRCNHLKNLDIQAIYGEVTRIILPKQDVLVNNRFDNKDIAINRLQQQQPQSSGITITKRQDQLNHANLSTNSITDTYLAQNIVQLFETYRFDTKTTRAADEAPLSCTLKFHCAGNPLSQQRHHMARYHIFNAINELGAYYNPSGSINCEVQGLDDSAFDQQKGQTNYVYGYDTVTLSPYEWIYLSNLEMNQALSLRKTILDRCKVAYFPDRDQYGIQLKTGTAKALDLEYCYRNDHNQKRPNDQQSQPTIPIISETIRADLDCYLTQLPIKEENQLAEILAYCADFKLDNPLKADVPDYLRPMLSQAGVCRHRAMACLMLCAYKKIPCRMVTNGIHAFVEIYDDPTHCWKTHDLGGAPADVSYSHPRPPNPISTADDFEEVQLSEPDKNPVHASDIENDDPDSIFKELFTKHLAFKATASADEVVELLSQQTHILVRYEVPQFAWNLNQRLLQHHLAKPNKTPRQYVYISDAKQMISLFEQVQITPDGKTEARMGPLKELIRNGGTLFINWSNFSAKETAIYKSILDDHPTLHDQSINNVRIISTEQVHEIKEDDSFYSRMRTIIRLPKALEVTISQITPTHNHMAIDESLENFEAIYLYEDAKNWLTALCGKPMVNVSGCPNYRRTYF
jgi:hypothetical protein